MEWVITKETEGQCVRDYLRNVHHFSRNLIKVLKYDGGKILVNGKTVSVRVPLVAGDCVTVIFPDESVSSAIKPENIPLDIVYEDEAILVINKPPQMAVSPSPNHETHTLTNAVLFYYRQHQIRATIHIVTRLDRDTSGLCLLAKNRYIHSLLSTQQKMGCIERCYDALINGKMAVKRGMIDQPIGRKEGSIIERIVSPLGKIAKTHYIVWQEYQTYTHVKIRLETGRTHQIRVHFSYLGYPLLGDDLYGGNKAIINRQALHCGYLGMNHPLTNEWLTFQCHPPRDMMMEMS